MEKKAWFFSININSLYIIGAIIIVIILFIILKKRKNKTRN
ncbi:MULTISPECIES: LPXTG cell wall anchor domain-containing protein [Bacillota]